MAKDAGSRLEPVAFNFGQGNGAAGSGCATLPGTLETYTYLGFHEYDWPTMDRLHRIGLEGPSEPQNRVPLVGVGVAMMVCGAAYAIAGLCMKVFARSLATNTPSSLPSAA
ncbi:MAG: hypothetical protein H6631_16470 [Anaerolineaceae bacterium]|nr:hypothetical protein [Anaerolineaceae bacterium]